MSIRARLLATLIPALLVLLGALVWGGYAVSREAVLAQINQATAHLAQTHAREFDALFESSRSVAQELAASAALMDFTDPAAGGALLAQTLENNPALFGSALACVPGIARTGPLAPYRFRTAGGVAARDLADPAYDYTRRPWYTEPVRTGAGAWSEPYFDEGGGDILMTTYSHPVHRGGSVAGVVTVDIPIETLVGKVRRLTVGGNGFAFIVTPTGRMVGSHRLGGLSEGSLWDLAGRSAGSPWEVLAALIRDPDPDLRRVEDPFRSGTSWLVTRGIPSAGWTLAVLYPEEEVLRPLVDLRGRLALLALLAAALMAAAIPFLASTFSTPLTALVGQSERYARGEFAGDLEEGTGPREIRRLSRSFNLMGKAIAEHIEAVRSATSQKERYRQELRIASEIQQGILPRIFPPFPELAGRVDLYGLMRPAREVAGDFFDCFRLGGGRIAVVVGDVSGKGAPSAFFMAMARMLVRTLAGRGLTPAEVLRRANHALAEDNASSMFVTLIYGEYDPASGLLRLAGAGHPPPVVLRPDGTAHCPAMEPELPLAALPGSRYHTDEFRLAPGEAAVFTTDGVTEAMDASDAMFGEQRLLQAAAPAAGASAEAIAKRVLEAVDAFSGEREQYDDITLLVLRRPPGAADEARPAGCPESARLDLPARMEVLPRVLDWTRATAREAGFDEAEAGRIAVAVEEVVVNVLRHAYGPGSEETFQVRFISGEGGMTVRVTDHGRPFDFRRERSRYDGRASAGQPVGGIGLHLVHAFMDEVNYEPDTEEGNVMILFKARRPGKASG